MPLLLTPAAPLRTASLLELASVYVIINRVEFLRLTRRAKFELGYYVNEAASLPESQAAQVDVNLPLAFELVMTPAQAGQVGDPETMLEAYATHELLALLPGATIETVA
jgi:hypothetical protein